MMAIIQISPIRSRKEHASWTSLDQSHSSPAPTAGSARRSPRSCSPAGPASKAAAWAYSNAARTQLATQGTEVVGVHVGYVDTDLTAELEGDKIAAPLVAVSALDALEAGAPEALVDELSRTIKAGLADDQNLIYPGIREQFAGAAV
jgi:NAD(P)-dependent dehydrogenase (short-subunit alcohol dehydrogenase family)